MKKRFCLFLSLFTIVPLLFAAAAFAEVPGGTAGSGQTVSGDVYSSDPGDELSLETDQPLSEIEATDPAEDIAPAEPGSGAPPAPLEGSWEEAARLAGELERELAGASPAVKLQELFTAEGGQGVPRLVAAARKINHLTRKHLPYINGHPGAKHAVIRLTDETVRLAHHKAGNDRAKLIVYRNAAQTYALLGAYKRAAGVMELALKLHPHRAGAYAEIKKLYRKVGAGGIKVFVRGQRPNFDVRPVIQNGRTLVPVRAISEALGAKVDYDPNNRKVFINNGSINIELTVDDDSAVVNGRNVKLDQAATVVNGRTLVPLRFVSENFGARVDWDGETQTVTVE